MVPGLMQHTYVYIKTIQYDDNNIYIYIDV